MQEQDAKARAYQNDEIDLVELVKGLWAQKWLIVAVTVAVTTFAVAYAFLTKPVYETKASVLPPQLSDIAEYNLGRDVRAGLKPFTVEAVYGVFTRSLSSEALRRAFFKEVYLPSLGEAGNQVAEDRLWKSFNQHLTITAPVKQRPEYWEVRVEHEDPRAAAEWVNLLVSQASAKTEENMQRNAASEIFTQAQAVERRIVALRNTAQQRREDHIAALEEALKVASSIGLEKAQVAMWQTFSTNENSSIADGSPLYLRGAQAIRAELEVLKNRQSDDPFIPELRGLQENLAFLKGVDISPDNVAVFTLDSAAQVPETPIKPKKSLILALGLVLGGMLGVFIALVRNMLTSASSRSEPVSRVATTG